MGAGLWVYLKVNRNDPVHGMRCSEFIMECHAPVLSLLRMQDYGHPESSINL